MESLQRLGGGALYGLLAAAACLGTEMAVGLMAGLPRMPTYALFVTGVLYGTGGIFIGFALAWWRLSGLRLAFGWTVIATSWVIGGRIAAAADGGVVGGLGLAFVALAGLVLALAVGQAQLGVPQVLRGLNALWFVSATALFSLNLHNLPSPLDPLSLATGALVCVVALAVASLAAWSAGDGAPWAAACALAGLSWGTVSAFYAAPETVVPRATKSGRPIVLIAVSGLRADHVSGFGYRKPTTPHLDALIGRGMSWRAASATSNWTVPALGSILTGQMPYTHGAGLNGGRVNGEGPLRIGAISLGTTLRQAGRVTAGVSGDPWDRTFGFDIGFDLWAADAPTGPLPLAVYPWTAVTGDPLLWALRRNAEAVTDDALRFVEAQKRGGWFLFVHYVDPAGPFLFDGDDWKKVGAKRKSWNGDDYDASLRGVDEQLGRLMRQLPGDAIVAVVGTRGVEVDEARPVLDVPNGTRVGHTLHEEMIHVPMVLVGASAGTSDRPVSCVDLAPSLLAMANVARPLGYDGVALREIAGAGDDRPVIAQSVRWGAEQQSVRIGQFKLIRDWNTNERVYDLVNDPAEVRPLDAGLDLVERELARHIPPPTSGAAFRHAESPSARLGAFLVDRWKRTPWGASNQPKQEPAPKPKD